MDADNRGINHGEFMVSIASQRYEHPVPDAAFRPSAVAAVNSVPIVKPLGQIAPRHARPVAAQYCLHTQAAAFGRYSNRLCPTRKQMRDLIPLLVSLA
jgi:hypothetical protein